ncbi:MAG: glycosyltransferase family 39 protein [Candidatus Levybacteria bacterium]|nr:glycosyltransferase family 39 protein [Candidatus Levybacteria bacterium]
MGKLKVILVIFILAVALILKLHNYSIYPQRGATSDEYSYSFQGISLWTKHLPISWSAFTAYQHRYDLTINKIYFPIVYPYFDHTPLNGLLVGGWSILFGQDTFLKVDLKTVRLVPIILSMISAIFVFLLAKKLYGYKTGIFALLIYATATIFVINGRVVLAENLLTPLFLLAIYLFSLWSKNISYKKSILIGILCGLSFWTKELGIALFLAMSYLFMAEKAGLKKILIMAFVFLFFVALYVVYGFYFDKEVFLQILFLQSGRTIGPQTLNYILSTPIIVNKVFYDGWYFFGFISLFSSFLNYKKNKIVFIPAFFYLFALIFALTSGGEMGWYIIPLFPFMAIASASLLVEGFKQKNWYVFVMLLFAGLSEIKLLYEANFGLTAMQFRVQLLIMFAPFILLLLWKKEKWLNILSHAWFYLLIFGNILITYNYIHPA